MGYRGAGETETGSDGVEDFEDTYKNIALNCFRYFGLKSFDEVNRLTISEYNLLMEAIKLKNVDMDYRNHLQAFLNLSVKAEKKAGKSKSKPVYTKFTQFYNYEAEIAKAKGKKEKKGNSRLAGIGKLLRKGV